MRRAFQLRRQGLRNLSGAPQPAPRIGPDAYLVTRHDPDRSGGSRARAPRRGRLARIATTLAVSIAFTGSCGVVATGRASALSGSINAGGFTLSATGATSTPSPATSTPAPAAATTLGSGPPCAPEAKLVPAPSKAGGSIPASCPGSPVPPGGTAGKHRPTRPHTKARKHRPAAAKKRSRPTAAGKSHHRTAAGKRHHPAAARTRSDPAPAKKRRRGASRPEVNAPPTAELSTRFPRALMTGSATSSSTTASTVSSLWTAGLGADPLASAVLSHFLSALANGNRPPAMLIPIYKAAARRYHVPWQVLAAINAVETGYGRNLSASSAGALGWMQFMPATWLRYGVSASRWGQPNPYDPRDAIYSAARYLAANGAASNLPRAIYAYNHATWYVQEVLSIAEQITTYGLRPSSSVQTKLIAMQATARLLNGMPYVWGGGHAGWPISAGYDCSGFISAVLHAAGYLMLPVSTQALVTQPGIRSGPGKWVTIFDRTDAATTSDHVIVDIIEGQWWESGGSAIAGGRASVHRIAALSASYLATFNLVLHPQGL